MSLHHGRNFIGHRPRKRENGRRRCPPVAPKSIEISIYSPNASAADLSWESFAGEQQRLLFSRRDVSATATFREMSSVRAGGSFIFEECNETHWRRRPLIYDDRPTDRASLHDLASPTTRPTESRGDRDDLTHDLHPPYISWHPEKKIYLGCHEATPCIDMNVHAIYMRGCHRLALLSRRTHEHAENTAYFPIQH